MESQPPPVPRPDKPCILLSPTAFKGTLSPFEAARAMKAGLRSRLKKIPIVLKPLADGGDGTLEVLCHSFSGEMRKARVKGPLGRPCVARWGFLKKMGRFRGPVAVLEMAEASGLKRLQGKNRIREASSVGTGQLIKAALRAGATTIILGVGGTACSDGGVGALHALGFRFRDRNGTLLPATPSGLVSLARIDGAQKDPALQRAAFYILCDVKNPLLGAKGSARVFGPQKGARPADVIFLEKFFQTLSALAPIRFSKAPGAGAAGGISYGLSTYLGARLVDGATFIRKVINWDHVARHASLIITGEGRLDHTSFSGKVIGGLTKNRGQAKVFVVCGATNLKQIFLRRKGIFRVAEMGRAGLLRPTLALKNATASLIKS